MEGNCYATRMFRFGAGFEVLGLDKKSDGQREAAVLGTFGPYRHAMAWIWKICAAKGPEKGGAGANRRSFDGASRDKTARGYAQDDISAGTYFTHQVIFMLGTDRGPRSFWYCVAMITPARSWLLLLAAFLCSCSAARAQHMNSADAPCRNVTVTLAMENCFDKAYKAADSGLNGIYSQISSVLQPDDLQRLKVAQRLWLQFRDATCTAESNLYNGGTASAPAYSACLEELTRGRTAELRTIYGWVIVNSR